MLFILYLHTSLLCDCFTPWQVGAEPEATEYARGIFMEMYFLTGFHQALHHCLLTLIPVIDDAIVHMYIVTKSTTPVT